MGVTMVKNSTIINEDYLRGIRKITSKDLDINEMENILIEIFQCGIDLSKAYCEAIKKSKEDERIRNINNNIWKYDKGYVDFSNCKAIVNESEIEIGYIAARILKILVNHKGNPVNREMLLDQIWGEDVEVSYRIIDTHISRLKRKLYLDDSIVSVRNIGYKLK